MKQTTKIPSFIEPMKATLTKDYFSDPNWIYEHKFDGERCLAIKKQGKVTLKSRNNNILNPYYPEIVAQLQTQKADNFIADGEIVATSKSKESFALLQQRMRSAEYIANVATGDQKKITIALYLFDVLYYQGRNVRMLPLLERKELLRTMFAYNKVLCFTKHVVKDGLKYFAYARAHGWEGVIAKRADSHYASTRSRDWLKFKCRQQQELVIAGYTAPQGNRKYFGALLVGYYKHKKLYYAGKIGTGYTQKTLAMLAKKLTPLVRKTCPFVDYDGLQTNIVWVKPVLVAEIKFATWTRDNKIRQGAYVGLRDDKKATEVVQEKPQ